MLALHRLSNHGSKLVTGLSFRSSSLRSTHYPLRQFDFSLTKNIATNNRHLSGFNQNVINQNKFEGPLKIGLHESLICNGEIRQRQERLVEQILYSYHKEQHNNDKFIVIVPATTQTTMADTEIPNYNLKQSSDFIYLTGLNVIKSLDSILVLLGGKQESTKSILFTTFNDARKNIWLGPDLAHQTSRRIDGLFDEVKPSEEFGKFIDNYINRGYRQAVTKLFRKNLTLKKKSTSAVQDYLSNYLQSVHMYQSMEEIIDVSIHLDRLKFTKSKSEMDAMRRACYIGSRSMLETIKWAQKSLLNPRLDRMKLNECQLVGRYQYETKLLASTKLTFWPVCAGQDRATAIHYSTNDHDIQPGDWVLMDAGCEEFDGYNSDITRTFPVSSKECDADKSSFLKYELFEALRDVHNRLLSIASMERICLDELYRYMLKFIAELLYEFKPFVNSKNMSASDYSSLATKYCPHHVSHYLGLDLHDTPSIARSTKLIQGVCFTIEPGLYFPLSDDTLKDEFKGIGYRIEDDCLVNEHDQFEILSRFVDHDLSFDKSSLLLK